MGVIFSDLFPLVCVYVYEILMLDSLQLKFPGSYSKRMRWIANKLCVLSEKRVFVCFM